MPKKHADKIANNPSVDPTLPKVELKLGNETFFLCFTFAAIAQAEAKLRALGMQINMLHALDLSSMDATRIVPLLYAALATHQPDLSFEDAAKLVTLKNLGSIFGGIARAYEASLAEPSAGEGPKARPENQ
jgi:hypothetical protein